MRLSLAQKFALPVVANGLALVGITALWLVPKVNNAFEAQIREVGAALPATLASSVVEIVATEQSAAVQTAIEEAARASNASYVLVLDKEGGEIAGTGPGLEGVRPKAKELSAAARAPRERDANKGTATSLSLGGQEFLDFATPIAGGALGTVHVGLDRTAMKKQVSSITISLQVVIYLALLIVTLGVIWFARRMVSPLRSLTAAATRIAKEGDLTQQVRVTSSDEVGELSGAFAAMVERLREVPLAIGESVRDLANASAEIYSTAQEQEAAAQQQSSAVEEVARTMQSLLDSAGHISESAQGVLANADRSKETSDLTARKIAELSGHTGRMGEILDVIREIANRSDLLALNASLEGTRAGEAGKGFSLVATEMRRLAERVMASVNDVKSLVTDVRASGSSTVLVTEEARKLAEATAGASRQIAMVSQQQRTATEQVSRSMKDAAGVLVQSVSAARQTRAAAENLKSQAERLKEIVGRFRVEPAKGDGAAKGGPGP